MINQLIKIEEVTSVMQSFSEITSKNTTSVTKCNESGQTLLDTIEANGGMNELLDQAAAEYLKKVKVTIDNMGNRRKPLTQIFDKIRSYFTTQEKAIDPKDTNTIPGKLAKKRDEYAAWKYAEEQKRKQEVIRTTNVNNEKTSYRKALENELLSHFNTYLNAQKSRLTELYNGITLADFERDTNYVLLFATEYPRAHYDKFISSPATFYIDPETKKDIRTETLTGKYETLRKTFYDEINDLKKEYSNRFATKRRGLEEIEELKKRDSVAAAQAEEAKRKQEAEETARQLAENKQREEMQRKEVEAAARTADMQSMFAAAEMSVVTAPAKVKVKEQIKVLHPAGIIELYNMWWLNEGSSLPLEELEKIHKRMITFCEKLANSKDPQRISSPYIKYEEDVKAK